MKDRQRISPAALGQRIVTRRTDAHMDQGELAIRSGLSRAYISRLENGLVANPKLFDLELIAGVLGISLPELVAPDAQLVETRYSLDFEELQRQVADLPPEQAERVIRGFRQSLEIAFGASDVVRRN